MKHPYQYPEVKKPMSETTELLLDLGTALVIGIGLAVCLFYGLSA